MVEPSFMCLQQPASRRATSIARRDFGFRSHGGPVVAGHRNRQRQPRVFSSEGSASEFIAREDNA